jgi:phospholipid/cholesterol/gamma-HCH transport system substrate-binding protein
MEKRVQVVYKEYFVGGFIIFAAVTFLILVLLTLAKRDLFTSRYTLKTAFANKSDLNVGAPVKISGMKVGQVKALYFNRDNRIEMVLELKSAFSHLVRENSVASIVQESFPISDHIISISPGTEPHPVLKEGMSLKSAEMLSMDAVISKVIKAFDDLSSLVASIKNGEGTLGKLITRDELYTDLRAMANKSGRLADNTRALVRQLNTLAVQANELVDVLLPAARQAGKGLESLPGLAQKAETLLDSANGLMLQLNASAAGIPRVLNKGEHMLEDAEDVVGALRDTWPIRGKVRSEPEDPPIFIDKEQAP